MRARGLLLGVIIIGGCSRAGLDLPNSAMPFNAQNHALPLALHIVPLLELSGGSGGGNRGIKEKDVAEGGGIGGLIGDAKAALFGATTVGGDKNCGCGVVFELTPQSGGTYKETVIHAFSASDGQFPYASLAEGSNGTLYGTTSKGGSSNNGTVYQLVKGSSGYSESVIYSFTGKGDGSDPLAPVVVGENGALYGTTNAGAGKCFHGNYGSAGCGTVYMLTPTKSGWTEVTLHAFTGGKDGYAPAAGLLFSGNALFGTTEYGGDRPCATDFSSGCGTVFRLTPSSSGYTEDVIERFGAREQDGHTPLSGLVADASGTLYGTTIFGGSEGCVEPPPALSGDSVGSGGSIGCGTIYKLTPKGSHYSERLLYTFTEAKSGSGIWPATTLVAGPNGDLYGTATFGGSLFCEYHGCGVIYRLGRGGSPLTLLYQFKGGKDGREPDAPLLYSRGAFYGETLTGGSGGRGTVYKLP